MSIGLDRVHECKVNDFCLTPGLGRDDSRIE